nr:YhgE/Pip domain-containing protein [Agromyces seonyuensis]
MIAAELRRLTASRMARIALLALMIVPLLYGGLYLWANQDPYARLDQVPVALVVADAGATEADGSTRNIGQEVADELLDDGTFDWHVVSASGAADGVDDQAFDFSITIPADFTAALESAATDEPRQAQLVLSTNDANSYLASTIGKQAIEQVRAKVAAQVGEEAARTLLTSVQTIRSGLVDATDGATQLADGLGEAVSGQSELAGGSAQVADGATQLANGTATLADGTSQLATGAHTLADGAAQVADGNAQLAAVADQAGAVVDDAAALLPQARTDLSARLAQEGVDQATIDEVLAALDPVADRLAEGNAQVQDAVAQVDALSAGATQVADGASTLAANLDTAAAGARTAADGASALQDGTAQLHSGVVALGDGLVQLDDGGNELASGLGDAVEEIPESSAETIDAQAGVISDPVDLETSAVTEADSYGAGLAPFFASLAAWIGIYALFLIVKPVSKRAVTALRSPVKITLAGWLTPGILGGIQMAALFGILAVALGFSVAHPLGTFGIMVLASMTFAAIILALNVWLGSVGQFLGLVLMVLQLVTAGGTFPWQTLPAPLAALHHVMPMSFVVDAMRQFMYGGDLARAGHDAIVLAGFLIGALAIAAIGVTRMTHTRTLRDLQPSLIG